jgi:hypothetical protein
MKKRTLFVGDCDSSVAKVALKADSRAIFISSTNYEIFLQSISDITGYTSLADLPKDLTIFCNLINHADCIVYAPPVRWSDNKTFDMDNPTASVQGLTEYLLYTVQKNKNNVVGLDLSPVDSSIFLEVAGCREVDTLTMWVAGCSTTNGAGVDAKERYGHLLGAACGLPVVFLSRSGTSISWAADQILRADIKENDIVVWGLTDESRLTQWSELENCVIDITAVSSKIASSKILLDSTTIDKLLAHKTNLLTAIQRIHEVINFCNKVKAKLLILNIHSSNTLNLYLHNIKEFFLFSKPCIDLGNDQDHPGPKQHQAYADFCQHALKQLRYI